MIKSLLNIIKEIKFFFSSLNIIIDSKNENPKIIFFSENKVYQKFSKSIIDLVTLMYPNQIYYISIDKEDKITNPGVRNYFINRFLLNFIFNNLKAKNLFLTVTDLGNNLIRKTNKIDNYIYFFHSPVSTTKNYTSQAFDNYDTIMCIGQFQIDEIRSREFINKLNKKNLIPAGYFYFDYLLKKINHNIKPNQILIAPSWNKNMKNFINENFIELIGILIENRFKVIFRPHPEHFKRAKTTLNYIKNKFSNAAFELDSDIDNIKSMEKAKCLITDSSGISIEYMIVLNRPVLYLDEYDKIHNSEYSDYENLKTIDHDIKENFGYIFKKQDFNRMDYIINDSLKVFHKKLPELKNFVNNKYFNFGNTQQFLSSYLKKII